MKNEKPLYSNVVHTFVPASEPKSTKKELFFWSFRQNNSGGNFVSDDNLDIVVIVEETSPKAANKKALSLGIYFDGVRDGNDCSCCGDRWYRVSNDEEGDKEPCVYDRPVFEYVNGNSGCPVVVHYYDGSKQYVKPLKRKNF